jgi:hypothetical protein
LITGGYQGFVGLTGTYLSSAEIYDPATGIFTATGSMSTPKQYHTATLLNNGTVLISGGSPDGTPTYLASAEIYDPVTGLFTAAPSLTIGRGFHAATLLNNGQLLLTGGISPVPLTLPVVSATAEIYQ